jgi:hypothetical protein
LRTASFQQISRKRGIVSTGPIDTIGWMLKMQAFVCSFPSLLNTLVFDESEALSLIIIVAYAFFDFVVIIVLLFLV